ncbi:RAC family serine/threonine-protein kinase homolog [Engystomops pustulosus]|uniref:RAC family serine/threonine-protein kinase homolog n=1 Tax=Engystomops pustulosus TaxID=76066 RepID=UPI003AFB7493
MAWFVNNYINDECRYIQDLLQSSETLKNGSQEKVNQNGGKLQENKIIEAGEPKREEPGKKAKTKKKNKITEAGEPKGEEEPGKKAKTKKKNKILARLLKPWKWLKGLVQCRSCTITDEDYCLSDMSGLSYTSIRGETPSYTDKEQHSDTSSGEMSGTYRPVQGRYNYLPAIDISPPGLLLRSGPTARSSSCHNIGTDHSSLDQHQPEQRPRSLPTSLSGCTDCSFLDQYLVDKFPRFVPTYRRYVDHETGEEFSVSSEPKTSAATVPLSLACFNFHQKLGQGAFGQVYLATDTIRKENVAIKVVDKLAYTLNSDILVERQILQISHGSPYLIHGLAAFHTNNFVYYVMELAGRGDLHNFIENNLHRLDTDIAKFITAELVCGVDFLHKQGIIHLDLKPPNILLTTEGHIKISDFGHAVTGVLYKTSRRCPATPGYAAPEMIRGSSFGRGVDYFAIGIILYRLMTGLTAFPGKYVIGRFLRVLFSVPYFPKYLTPDQVSILEGLLCKDQDQRLGVNGDIRRHPFFSEINWEDVEARRLEPPAILKTAAFGLSTEGTLDYTEPCHIRCMLQRNFQQFDFVCPEWSKQYHPVITTTGNSVMSRLLSILPNYFFTC